MNLRSLLFVPGDRPERFEKAAMSGADTIILDLEDSVVWDRKAEARKAVANYLSQDAGVARLVRVNPLDSSVTENDLAAIMPTKPDGIVFPKAEGADSIQRLISMMDGRPIPILPIATETPKAIFQMGSYAEVREHLLGLTWGAEDLPAAIGAETSRNEDGSYTAPYELARSLTLFGAHAAGVAAIETVYPDFRDADGLARYAARGARDGFTGMMAIHPAQVEIINMAFAPTDQQVAEAQLIVDAFAENPSAGVLQIKGKMIDAPHLKAARNILERSTS